MTSDENMELWIRSLIDTYFEKVQWQVQNGKGLVEIINENLADNAELMLQVDMIREETTKENYWKNLTSIAELAKKYGKNMGNDFYGRIYDAIVEISQDCFEADKVYTLDDLNVFRAKMQSVYEAAQMPDYMMQTGKTQDKIFLLAATAHAKEGGEKYAEQMINFLEILKEGKLDLGVATEDLEDFCLQLAVAYDEIKLHGNEEQKNKFQELFMHNFCYTNNLEATNIKFRKSNYIIEKSNSYLKKVEEDILSEPDFYTRKVKDEKGQDVSNIEKMFRTTPQIFLNKLKSNQGFLRMFAAQVLKEPKEDDELLFFDNIKNGLLGKKYPTINEIYSFDYSSYNEIVPLLLKQDVKDTTESTISRLKKSSTFTYNVEQALKDITSFANVGETEFAVAQATKLSEKIAEVYTPEISLNDKHNIAIAMLTQKAEISEDIDIDFSKTNPDVFIDVVNGLKQYIANDKWKINRVKEEMKSLGEKNPEALRVLEFLETDGIVDYSQMLQEPVLTPEIIQEMARNPEVQQCIPGAQEALGRVASIEKTKVEH